MTFDSIPAASGIFLDANCLVYAATTDPQYGLACERLLDRIENKELQGFTSSHVLSELAHRLMTIEAAMMFGRPMTGIANWLRRHPKEVQRLRQHRQSLDDLIAIPITFLSVSSTQVSRAADLSSQFGLLSGDALIVAVMRDHGLTLLASNDADFDWVPGITRYAPV